ncbi:MAG: rane fusion protein heavy metal efflux system [Mycobacterium sp.]|nr:rane fusion protein heavy metal efflux system [Mycobacterium sp.]
MKKTFRMLAVALLVAAFGFVGFKVLSPAAKTSSAKAPDQRTRMVEGRAEPDEHGADRVFISDAKLAAGGVALGAAASAVLSETLHLNGMLRANQESVVQVTPRFPGVVRDIRKRIGDAVVKGDQLASIESNQSLTTYDLKAPISGTIIQRQISLGEYASEQKPAFVVADLSTIWAELSVYRHDFKRVRIGDEVLIDPDDGGGDVKATISYVSPVGASDTQTALARAVLTNPDGRLRPGLFVTARLVLAKRNARVAVRVGAIQTLENKTVVFVREGDKIEARPVLIGESDAQHAEVKSGLSEGERYVAENSFVVKAEMYKGGAIGE